MYMYIYIYNIYIYVYTYLFIYLDIDIYIAAGRLHHVPNQKRYDHRRKTYIYICLCIYL